MCKENYNFKPIHYKKIFENAFFVWLRRNLHKRGIYKDVLLFYFTSYFIE